MSVSDIKEFSRLRTAVEAGQQLDAEQSSVFKSLLLKYGNEIPPEGAASNLP